MAISHWDWWQCPAAPAGDGCGCKDQTHQSPGKHHGVTDWEHVKVCWTHFWSQGWFFCLWSLCGDGRGKPRIKTCWDQAVHSSTELPFLLTWFCSVNEITLWFLQTMVWSEHLRVLQTRATQGGGIFSLLRGTNSKHATFLTFSFPSRLLLLPALQSLSTETIPSVTCPFTCFHGKEWAPLLALIHWYVISPREFILESAVRGMWWPPLCPEELCLDRASSGFNCSLFLGLAQQLSSFGLKGRGHQGEETNQGCACKEESAQNHSESKSSA